LQDSPFQWILQGYSAENIHEAAGEPSRRHHSLHQSQSVPPPRVAQQPPEIPSRAEQAQSKTRKRARPLSSKLKYSIADEDTIILLRDLIYGALYTEYDDLVQYAVIFLGAVLRDL
jgi:hypothetical protein